MCPYTVMYELSNAKADPMEPMVINAAVATNITLRPTMSARDPAGEERSERGEQDERKGVREKGREDE